MSFVYDISLNSYQLLFVPADSALKKTKTHPNTKFLPIVSEKQGLTGTQSPNLVVQSFARRKKCRKNVEVLKFIKSNFFPLVSYPK